jgi:hypothetical protein
VQQFEIVRWEEVEVVMSSHLADTPRVHSITLECGRSANMGRLIMAQIMHDSPMTSNVVSPLVVFSIRRDMEQEGIEGFEVVIPSTSTLCRS